MYTNTRMKGYKYQKGGWVGAWVHGGDFKLFKVLYKLVGGAKKDQEFHWSYADISEFSVIFWSIQLASA